MTLRPALALALTLLPANALAAPANRSGPLGGCPAVIVYESVPIDVEAVYWTSAGRSSTNSAAFGIGTEWTSRLLTWRGFPSGPYGGRNGRAELRGGAWASGATRLPGGVVEGGAVLDVSALYHASWGTFTLRGGGGYGAFADDRAAHVTGVLAYGVRSVLARYASRGACDPAPRGHAIAEASIARLFLSYRHAPALDAHEWIFGVELSPTFFLYPLTWWRVAGGPPR